jgi:hypothetical protein
MSELSNRPKRKSTRPLSQLIARENEQISATQNPLIRIGVTRGRTSKRGRGRGGRSGSVRGGRFPSTQNIDTSEDIAEEACSSRSSSSSSSSNVEDVDEDEGDNTNLNSENSIQSSATQSFSHTESANSTENAVWGLDADDLRVYTIDELLSLAKKKQFPPKKLILFGRKRKAYTVVLHCFNHIQQFQKRPDQIQFHCKECLNEENNKTSITVKITPKADFTNLNKHLNIHKKTKEWYDLYLNNNNSKIKNEKIITNGDLSVIKFFITADTAINQLKNDFLRDMLDPSIKIYSHYTFRYKLIPSLFTLLFAVWFC